MRINIKGNAVTTDSIAEALKCCEKEYGIKVKNATLYVRFQNENGESIEPTEDDHEIVKEYVFDNEKAPFYKQMVREIARECGEPISAKEMGNIIEEKFDISLNASDVGILFNIVEKTQIDRKQFLMALDFVECKISKFNIRYLEKYILNMHHEKINY